MSIFVNIRRHCAWWLISNHRAVDAGADWALDPLFLSLEHSEARFMNEMTTSEGNDVLIIFFYKFILVVLLVLKLKLANAALIMRRFFSHQPKLKSWKIGIRDSCMLLVISLLFFLIEENIQILDVLVQFMIISNFILLMDLYSTDLVLELYAIISRNRLFYNLDLYFSLHLLGLSLGLFLDCTQRGIGNMLGYLLCFLICLLRLQRFAFCSCLSHAKF